jgi:hypothetical protein
MPGREVDSHHPVADRTPGRLDSTIAGPTPAASQGAPQGPSGGHVRRLAAALVVFATLSAASAGSADDGPANPYGDEPIEDNSFLLEEAYNQQAAVVQHISMLTRGTEGKGWAFSFTQEWPAPVQRHQLSYTLAGLSVEGEDGHHTGIGDAAINYRYQLARGSRLGVAPRISLLVPFGDEDNGLGSGTWGVQLNLPVSVRALRRLVSHTNLGYTAVRGATGADGSEADTGAVTVGQSLVYLVSPRFNLMLEATWTAFDEVVAERRSREEAAFVSPGLRFAIDTSSGLQIVPGIAFPIGVGRSDGENAVLLYLSFEHPFAPLAR